MGCINSGDLERGSGGWVAAAAIVVRLRIGPTVAEVVGPTTVKVVELHRRHQKWRRGVSHVVKGSAGGCGPGHIHWTAATS